MGSVGCCQNSTRVDTLKFDDVDSSSQASNKQIKDDQFSRRVSSPGQEALALQIHYRQPQIYKNHACISTAIQSYSFKTLSSEHNFSNFVTFQPLQSSKDQQSSKNYTNKSNQIEEFNDIQLQLSSEFQSSDYIKLPSHFKKII